jgi:ABC-type transport system involved in multi-copper enzyme maturation permease subunit
MVRHIVAREFLESLESSRFIISTVLCVCLIVLAVYVSIDDYVQRLREHDVAVATYEKQPQWTTIYRRPRVLGIFSEGVDKHVGNMVEISIWASPFRASGYGWQSRETEYMASFASIDVAFVIKFILSLLAIFLTYDAISGEREAGLLRLVLSNSISRCAFLIGKLLGRFLSLLIPLVMGILISLLFLLTNFFIELTTTDFLRIGLFFGVAILYVSVFLCIGLAISAAVRSPALSLIILLTVWILTIVVYPILGVIAAENLHPIDHPETMEEKLRNIEEKYQKRFNENWAIRQRLEKEGKRKEQEKYIAQYHAISIEQAEVVDKAERDFLRQFTSQANFARSLLRLSPAECFSNAAEAVVSTDIEAYDRFMEINRQFWHQYVEHYKKALYENRPEAREMKFPEEPKIKYPLSESLQRATIDIALLILLAGLCFIAAYTIFVRSEV